MIDPKALLPILKSSLPKADEGQLLQALESLAKAHPDLNNMQALAALQKYFQDKQKPSIGMMAQKGAIA